MTVCQRLHPPGLPRASKYQSGVIECALPDRARILEK
jgi:hypothetical protein